MQLDDYLRIARRWLPVALVLALLAGAGSYAFTKRFIRPVYSAQSIMQVDLGMANSTSSLVDPQYNTLGAVTDASIASEPPSVNRAISRAARNLHIKLSPSEFRSIASSASCQTQGSTALFSCAASSYSPQLAAAVANSLAAVFISSNQSLQQSRYKSVLAGIRAAEAVAQAQHDTVRYDGLVQLENSTRLAAVQQASIVRVVANAAVPNAPSSPNPKLNALLAFFLVFLLVGSAGIVSDRLDRSLRAPEDLRTITPLPILGTIPVIRSLKGKPLGSGSLILPQSPRSQTAEAFRVVRAGIAFETVDKPVHVLLVTSTVAGEGKSTVAANLASAFAETGASVIAVDLDLRRPTLGSIFGSNERRGLTTLFLDRNGVPSQYLSPTIQPNLQVLPSGPIPPNPASIINSERLSEILQQVRALCDVVIVDSPPALAAADAAVLAAQCDAAVMVVRPGSLTRNSLARAIDRLSSSGVTVAGLIVNAVKATQNDYYQAYSYRDEGSESANAQTAMPADILSAADQTRVEKV